jgi:hypothetical protein
MRIFAIITIWLMRLLYAMTLVVGIVGIWWDLLQTKIAFGLTWQYLGFIVFALASLIVLGQLLFKIHQYEHKKPTMVYHGEGWENVKAPLYNKANGQITGIPRFSHAIFANNPKDSSKGAIAEKVVGHLEFYDKNRKKLIFPPMIGRWAETPERAEVGARVVETNQIDIAPNAMPRTLDIVLKYDDEDDCYGLNNDTPQRAPSGWRDNLRKLPPGEYAVKIRLRGTNYDNCNKPFWLEINNQGKNLPVVLKPLCQ